MSDLNREDFEIWVKKRSASSPSGFYPQLLFRCALEPERYMISWVDSAFEGWKASREFLVIELPEPYVWDNDGGFERESDPDSECSMALIPKIDVMQSIHAAGVKTK